MKRRGFLNIALAVLALALAGLAGKRLSSSHSHSTLARAAFPGSAGVSPASGSAGILPAKGTPSAPDVAGKLVAASATNKLFSTAETFWSQLIAESPFAAFHDWAERYVNAPSTEKPALEAEGLQLAGERRAELSALIASNPERALELSVPLNVREALPDAVQAQLEQRFSGRGRLAVLGALAEPGREREVDPLFRVATVNNQDYKAFVYGRRLGEPTRDNIPLHGIALDNRAAVAEDPVRILEPSEAAAAKARISDPICTVSGLSSTAFNQEVAADIGGQPRFFCHTSHAVQANSDLIAGESGPPGPSQPSGQPQASTWTEGLKKVILIRVDFSDLTNQPFADSTGIALLSGLNSFYTEMSYGRTGFYTNGAGSDMTPTFRMPQPASYYGTNNYYDALRADARSAATAAGYNLANYDRDVICMGAVPGFGWSGLAYVGSGGAWLRASFSTGVAGHELGHNWGLWHANYWDTGGQSVAGSGTSVEYGDVFDTMGSASAGNNHFNARYKAYLNWLTTSDWQTVSNNGTYRIYAHDNQNSLGTRALLIPINGQTNYSVEFRQKFTSNKWLMNGAGLRSAWTANNNTQLLDTTPGSPDGKNDSAIVIGRTYSDTTAGIHITPIGKGGTTPESLDVVVNFGFFPGNLPPTLALSASATNAAINVALSFNATATDPNGDALAYYWDFGDGNFGTNGPVASKSWASAGEYVVRCAVSDMKGGVTSKSVIVVIGSPATYRIGGQISTTNGPVQGARVYVSTTRMAYTDSDGTYTIVGLPAGTYTVNASLEGYTFTAAFTNPLSVGPNQSGANFLAAYTPPIPPTITTQPLSKATNLAANVTFTVGVTGAPPIYFQWRFNGASIASATGSSYTKNNVQATNAGNYSVVVSNRAGVVTSSNAVLTVNTPPTITAQPQGLTVIAGNPAPFNVGASGTATLCYQWRFKGTNIAGATASSYTRSNVQTNDAGNYMVVVTNSLGSVTSAPAPLTALTAPLSIASITASNGSVTLSWQSISGKTYRVDYKNNLTDTSWTALSSNVTATGPTTARTDSSGAARRFYRLVMY